MPSAIMPKILAASFAPADVRFRAHSAHCGGKLKCLQMTQNGYLVANNPLGPPRKAVHVGAGALGQNIQDHTDPRQVGKLAMDQKPDFRPNEFQLR
jgi:hypothetical protein